MKPGDQVMFWIPWQLAYGEFGRPGGIPPKSDLMFQVELIGVTPAAAPNAAAWAKVTPWPTDSSEIIRTASGLEYLIVETGDETGASPTDNDYAYVHFQGRLDDGSVVESTFESQRPQPFPVADLVPGWNEALKLMRKGDRMMVRVPAHLMYGDEGDGRIPPGAGLTYEIVLEDVIVIEAPTAAPPAAEPPQ
jgi:FKBP-type peptidyl-prolyl cis-trans isomerase